MAYNACFDGLLCFDWQLFLNLTQKTKSVVALNLKTALILKVFNALRQAKIACFQYLASTKFNANQNQQQYLALKFLYFKFKLLIYDPKLLKTSKQLPNAIKTLLLASKACQRNNKIAKKWLYHLPYCDPATPRLNLMQQKTAQACQTLNLSVKLTLIFKKWGGSICCFKIPPVDIL